MKTSVLRARMWCNDLSRVSFIVAASRASPSPSPPRSIPYPGPNPTPPKPPPPRDVHVPVPAVREPGRGPGRLRRDPRAEPHAVKQSANTTASATPSALRVDAARSRCSANSRSVSSNRASSAWTPCPSPRRRAFLSPASSSSARWRSRSAPCLCVWKARSATARAPSPPSPASARAPARGPARRASVTDGGRRSVHLLAKAPELRLRRARHVPRPRALRLRDARRERLALPLLLLEAKLRVLERGASDATSEKSTAAKPKPSP